MAILDFLGISKTLKDFAGQVSAIRLEIEQVQCEIEDVEFAPAATSDLLAALKAWAASNEEAYNTHLKNQLNRLHESASILSNPGAVNEKFFYGAFLQEPRSAKMSFDVQLCGLLGAERFAQLMAEKLETLDLQKPGLTLEMRAKKIDELKAKKSILEKKQKDLVDTAEKAGLSVS